jgi:hypothetical protein
MMRGKSLYRITMFVLAALLVSCKPTGPTLEQVTPIQLSFDQAMMRKDLLCIEVPAFPLDVNTESSACPKCAALIKAGVIEESVNLVPGAGSTSDLKSVYALTAMGKKLYTDKPDEEWVAALLARQKGVPNGWTEAEIRSQAKPRVCLGRTRFHHLEELGRLTTFPGGETAQMVSLVAQVHDDSGLLFDPRLAPLNLSLPPKPKPGEPILQSPMQLKAERFPQDKLPELIGLPQR